jgi:hypothetical protein
MEKKDKGMASGGGGERCCVNLWVFGVGMPAVAAAALTEINYKYWTAAGMCSRALVRSPKNIFRGRKEIIDCVWRVGYNQMTR